MRGVELMRRMDIASYLEQQKAELGKQTKQVKDFSVFDFGYIPAQPVVRVTWYGASAYAGTDALGGVVNIVTKSIDKPFTFGSATYGSYETFYLNLVRAQKIGNFSYLVSFAHAQSEGDFKFKSVNDLTLTRINNDLTNLSKLLY